MSKIRLHGSSSGYTEIAPVAASGNNTLTLPNDGTIISKDSNGAVGVTSITVGTGVTIGDGRITCTTLHGSATSLTSIPAANIVGVCTAGFERTGGFSDYVKLQRATSASGGSDLIFDDLDVTTYKFFDFWAVFIPENDSVKPFFRFRTGGSSGADVNGAHYDYAYRENYPTNTGGDVSASDQNEIRLHGNLGNSTGAGEGLRINIRMMFADSNDNGSTKQLSNFISWSASRHDASTNYRTAVGSGVYNENTTTYPTGFKILMGSGAINAVSYGIYGLKR